MIKKHLLLVISLATIALCGNVYAGEKQIVNGIDANFPPFAYMDAKGVPSGFDVEAMNWIAKEIGLEVTHRPIEWGRYHHQPVDQKNRHYRLRHVHHGRTG